MPTIRQTLSLTDGMSGPLKSMNKALRTVLNSFEAMQSASGQSIDTEAIQAARRKLDRADVRLHWLTDLETAAAVALQEGRVDFETYDRILAMPEDGETGEGP